MTDAIFNDDPHAAEKLEAKITKLEAFQDMMRKGNTLIRAEVKKGLSHTSPDDEILAFCEKFQEKTGHTGLTLDTARLLLKPDFCNRIGFADYQLTNNGANIRRLKQRLAALK